MLDSDRQAVAAAARRLAAEGLVLGSAGNVSVRRAGRVAVTATGAVLERITAEQVVVVNLEGELLAGEPAPTSELALHLGAYRRYGVGAVVHTHAPMATAVACVLDELPVIHYAMTELGGAVRVAPYATFGTGRLAELTLDALAGRSAALMSNHGTIAVGEDVETAVQRSRLLEWAATMYWRAAALGSPRVLDEEQTAEFRRAMAQRGYTPLPDASR